MLRGNDGEPRHGTDPGLFKHFSSLNLASLCAMAACFHVPIHWGRLPWKSPPSSRSRWAAQLPAWFLTRRAGRREFVCSVWFVAAGSIAEPPAWVTEHFGSGVSSIQASFLNPASPCLCSGGGFSQLLQNIFLLDTLPEQ